jgi:hypothetical protein
MTATDHSDATPETDAAGATPDDPQWSVGLSDPTPAATCPHCGRPFRRERHLDLHLGLDHGDRVDDGARERFETAYIDEGEEIRRFRLKVLAVLVVLYFGFLFTYSVAT